MAKDEENLAKSVGHEREGEAEIHEAPGTTVLVIVLLVTFAVYYFANWKALADAWHVR